MRPDEHKKKRSAQYQKKQGKGGKAKEKSGVTTAGASQKPQGTPANIKSKTSEHADSTDSEDSSSETRKSEQRPTFSRRQIVSNWNKYELTTNEREEPTQKGDDYVKLLGMAGGATAQFRFQEELGWEEDESALNTQYLALDCESLASSLQCLPLYQKLGLDEKLFTEKQIGQMIEEATAHRKTYTASISDKESAQQVEPLSTLSDLPDLDEDYLDSTGKAHTGQDGVTNLLCGLAKVTLSETDTLLVEDHTKRQTVENSIEHKASVPSEEKSSIRETTPRVPNSFLSSQEDELDFLLSLDSPQQPMPEVESQKPSADTTVKPTMSEDNQQKTSVTMATPLQQKSDDLEDWLDSVLDD